MSRGGDSVEVSEQRATSSFWREAWATLVLALPLIAGQLGQMLMGVADTVMIGRVGVVPLAASTFANTLLMVPFLFGVGLLTSISIRVSQGRGAERLDDVKHALRHGTWLALVYGVLVMLLALFLLPFLDRFGQVDEVVDAVPGYMVLAAMSLVPAMVTMAWKNYGDALSRPWQPFTILMAGVALNIGLNWLLIYGNWGAPALGLTGAGWATLLSRIFTVAVMYFWLMHAPGVKEWSPHRWWGMWKEGEFGHLLRLGVPIGLQLTAEVGSFAAASLMVGSIGVVALAAHQVALTCTSTSFMIPLGVAMAITVRMGEASGASLGSNGRDRLRTILLSGWAYGLIFTGASMFLFITCGEWLARKIVLEPEVIKLSTSLLLVAGVFQLVDGSQVISSSALRGMGDVKVPAWMGVFSYWVIAVPCSAYLAFGADMGAEGVWWGLAVGLGTAAVMMGGRAWSIANRSRNQSES